LASEPARRRVGRPALIDRAVIAATVAAMPVEAVSMRAVAEALGVSVPGLYHWVNGRDELLQLAAEQAAERVTLPEEAGQQWSVWLFQWAEHARRAFVADPGLLRQFAEGKLGLARMFEAIDTALGLLVRQGFSETDALDAFYLVSQLAVGAAVSELRRQQMERDGHAEEHEYRRLLARKGPEELPHLRRLAENGSSLSRSFADETITVIAGLAVRRDEPWRDVVAQLHRHLDRED
jgi:AcrR family transcriptional regulator